MCDLVILVYLLSLLRMSTLNEPWTQNDAVTVRSLQSLTLWDPHLDKIETTTPSTFLKEAPHSLRASALH